MKIAVLGVDATTLALAKAVVDRADLEIALVCELDQAADPAEAELLRAIARGAKPLDSWEGLLDRDAVDGVIVARGVDEERRSEQLRKFAQLGIPVLISHPVIDSMLLYYELDMIRSDTGAIIVPALQDRLHPAIAELAAIVSAAEASPIGKVDLVILERQLADRSKSKVTSQFARDVDLLRVLCGELNQIGAMGTSGEDSAYGNLTVQLTGPSGLLARWAVVPVENGDLSSGRVVMTGSSGKATLSMQVSDGHWSLSVTGAAVTRDFGSFSGVSKLLDVFVEAIQGKPSVPDLLDAARAVELTETISRSLARRRTIELNFGDHTEENTFKGKMAAGGCLLLMLGLGVLMFVAVFDKANIPGARFWPWLLAGAFGLFSLLQLLTLAFKK